MVFSLALLSGCSTPSRLSQDSAPEKLSQAAISPLKTLNIAKEDIPVVLKIAKNEKLSDKNAKNEALSCSEIALQIKDLESLIGLLPGESELDKKTDSKKDIPEKVVVSAVERSTEVIPLKGVVAKLSGAEKHDKKVRAHIEAGKLRKAFLIGLEKGKNCTELPAKN